MRVIIIEDEIVATKYLSKILNKMDQEVEVVKTLDSVKSSIKYLKKYKGFELIFADVQLGDGICFEIFKEVAISVPVVFTTAYDEYAIKAFKLNSIDYILKPLKQEDIEFAIEKYKQGKMNSQSALDQITSLIKVPESKPLRCINTLLIQSRSGLVPVKVNKFSFFYLESNIVRGVTASNKSYVIDKTISELEEGLSPELFYRANRQLLVHHDAVDRVYHYYHGKLRISVEPNFDDTIIISKAKSKDFKNWLTSSY